MQQRTVSVAEDVLDVDAGVRAGCLEVRIPIEHVVCCIIDFFLALVAPIRQDLVDGTGERILELLYIDILAFEGITVEGCDNVSTCCVGIVESVRLGYGALAWSARNSMWSMRSPRSIPFALQ